MDTINNPVVLDSLLLTLKLALTILIFQIILIIPLAWSLFKKKESFLTQIIEGILTLPMFLPPTVLGFYYIFVFKGNDTLLFTFNSIFIVGFISSLPIFLKSTMNSFVRIDKKEIELCQILGADNLDIFYSLVLPQAKYGILKGLSLSFAHVMGAFGALFMVGGSIPRETKVLSILLFENVESLNFNAAHEVSLLLIIVAIIFLFGVNYFSRKSYG